jgi:hypothetical protein
MPGSRVRSLPASRLGSLGSHRHGFTVEDADLLVSLYGVKEMNWDDLEQDKEGFVAFSQLERYLVHNPSLLSRRIRKLANAKPPLLEAADGDPTLGQHVNSKRVRITKEGAKRIEPVWTRYQHMSAKLLEGIPPRLLDIHHDVNQRISAEVRKRRAGLSDPSSGNS